MLRLKTKSVKHPTKKTANRNRCSTCFLVHGANCLKCLEKGPRVFVPTNPDLANIFGRTDLDFENVYSWYFFGSQCFDFQIPGFPEIWKARPGLGFGWAWAGRGSGLGGAKANCHQSGESDQANGDNVGEGPIWESLKRVQWNCRPSA